MSHSEKVCYYPGKGQEVEVIELGIETICGTQARVRFNDGRIEVVPEAHLACPVSERKQDAFK
jgi:hypothetical protein